MGVAGIWGIGISESEESVPQGVGLERSHGHALRKKKRVIYRLDATRQNMAAVFKVLAMMLIESILKNFARSTPAGQGRGPMGRNSEGPGDRQ